MNLERFQYLMTKALDNELTNEEKSEFEQLIYNSKELQNEWNSMKKIKEISSSMKFKSPPEELWEKYWLSVYSRLERGIAWILISLGAIIILIYGAYKFFESIFFSTEIPLILKISISSVVIGLIVLFVSIIRERFFLRKSDKYKEILR